jgi:aerobic-type carbon monoxide dehydrogenase small subunit (CoxS/CutS family)
MKVKKERKNGSSPQTRAKADSKTGARPVGAMGSAIAEVANAKVSRRTLLKGTATAVAVVGVSSVAMKSIQMQPLREQSSSGSTTSTSTIQTNTGVLPPPPALAPTDPLSLRTIVLNINGANHTVNVEPRSMLVDVLRDQIGLIATKRPCNRMECGACTILIDGAPHESCAVLAVRAVGHTILTSEVATKDPVVNALQQAWLTEDGGQCTFCGPGMIMTAAGLLKQNPNPSVSDIKEALSGNLCRCGNYPHIIAAVQLAAKTLGGA